MREVWKTGQMFERSGFSERSSSTFWVNVNSLVTWKGPIHLLDSLEEFYLAGRFFVDSMTCDPTW